MKASAVTWTAPLPTAMFGSVVEAVSSACAPMNASTTPLTFASATMPVPEPRAPMPTASEVAVANMRVASAVTVRLAAVRSAPSPT